MTTYLITGGGGYLAASLTRHALREGGRVRRLDRRALEPWEGGEPVEDLVGDMTRKSDVERAIDGVDVIFHLAAQTSVYVAEADPLVDVTANVLPMLHLLEACRAAGTHPKLVFASTATVCGLPARLPVDESFPDEPVTIYDLHKLVAERYLRHYVSAGVVCGASLRLANVYGPGPTSSGAERGVLNAMVRRALAGAPLQIYGSGDYLRDYIHVDDVARAFVLTAGHAEQLAGRSFVLGTGTGHTLAEAIRLVARLTAERTGRQVDVVHVEPPTALSPIEARNYVARPEALRQATGFRSSVALEPGLVQTIAYYATMVKQQQG